MGFPGLSPKLWEWSDLMKDTKTKRHKFLILLLLLAITGIVYIGSESFQIKKITVVGNDNISQEDIIKRSGLSYNQNIFKLDKKLTQDRIESNPYLEVLSITTRYPDEVVIKLKEKKASAIIPYLNSYFIIDEECYIMEIDNELDDIEYPLIQDMQVRNFVVGKKLTAAEEYQVKVLSRILEAINQLELGSQISEIMMGDPDNVELILTDGIRVRIGQAIEIDKKLLWLSSEEIKEVCKGLVGGILDLSVPSQPVFYSDES